MNNILEIENLVKNYPGFSLNNIKFSIPQGTIVGLTGENGAGKTNMLLHYLLQEEVLLEADICFS